MLKEIHAKQERLNNLRANSLHGNCSHVFGQEEIERLEREIEDFYDNCEVDMG